MVLAGIDLAWQIKLAALLHQLNDSKVLKLIINNPVSQILNESKIQR
ncbi:MAG: hypothetical protein H0A75_02440 [Candidatus Methanofishera endochildressiae]|uniref:Uncharacterized protein n=1 Tax=Candidatus Methanofishera endochildressiae TaxID=2738884 RepID=A0A7Z0SES6_9GAMM|nr:hypothetical protein [Candidatus Methanofishera endochildressiae]